MVNPKKRFSNRVEHYIRSRPGYPSAILDVLRMECGLTPEMMIADIGFGTGLLTRLFLENGNPVFGIEPNREMRQAGEKLLRGYKRFSSLGNTAEETGLPENSIDFITAGQAFHWFDARLTRAEFQRILKPEGWVVLVWNERRTDSSPFLLAYEQLMLDFSTEYKQVNHRLTEEDPDILPEFFGSKYATAVFENPMPLDYTALEDRLLSTSYVPAPETTEAENMLQALRQIFSEHQVDGLVQMEYDCRMYYGQLAGA